MIKILVAFDENRVIGKNNELIWHLPADLKRFKALTTGHVIIMGRKTWDSLPARFRPLPGRRNIVVTRQPDWQADGAIGAHSLAQAVQQAAGHAEVWVIGGADIYAQALPLASSAHVTEIEQDFAGDAQAPVFDNTWLETARVSQVSANGLAFSFVTLQKIRP